MFDQHLFTTTTGKPVSYKEKAKLGIAVKFRVTQAELNYVSTMPNGTVVFKNDTHIFTYDKYDEISQYKNNEAEKRNYIEMNHIV